MNDTVVAIVSAFFVIGILVGIIAVVATVGPPGRTAGAVRTILRICRTTSPVSPRRNTWGDDTGPDGHPRWPGEADTDFRGR